MGNSRRPALIQSPQEVAPWRHPGDVLKQVKDEGVEVVDVRFCDLPGLMQHFSVPAHELTEDVFEDGLGFDGSSIRGFQEIQESDMLLMPDPSTAIIDPFREHKTLNINAFVKDPVTGESYSRDPRYIAKKAEDYLKGTGLADTAYFGPEAEFYIFDSVRFDQNQYSGYYFLDSVEGVWNSGRDFELDGSPNLGYKPRYKEGYFPVPPMDSFQDLRSEMVRVLEQVGISIEVQHHEVGTAGQAEIDMRFDELSVMADKLMLYKYVVKSVARQRGYSVTFMPKPIFQDNGSGMHVHQSLWKGGEPLFFDEKGYAGLSDMARWYIGGLLKHAAARVRVHQPDDELVQAARAGLRGAGQPRVLAAEPVGVGAHPAVLEEPEGEAARVPVPGPELQPVPRVLGDAHGRPRRDREPHRAADAGRPRPLRPPARGAREGPAGSRLAQREPRRARGRPRVPARRRRVHARRDRHVDRVQAHERDRPGAAPPAPVGVLPLLRHLIGRAARFGVAPRRSSNADLPRNASAARARRGFAHLWSRRADNQCRVPTSHPVLVHPDDA